MNDHSGIISLIMLVKRMLLPLIRTTSMRNHSFVLFRKEENISQNCHLELQIRWAIEDNLTTLFFASQQKCKL